MILITGAAGFIGFYVASKLLDAGHHVIGVDCVNDYYDPALKEARLVHLESHPHFTFYRTDIADQDALQTIAHQHPAIETIIHLAAQAGVRYSLENPHAYGASNLIGHLNMLEWARHNKKLKHFIYASSSSVYGNDSIAPFTTNERCDTPVSLYAATKRSCEMLTHSYVSLYGIPATGLRFFTVYGPFGRPDMAYFSFTKAILEGTPIKIFNNGDLRRDFTYIDDIVDGVIKTMDAIPTENAPHTHGSIAHRILNLGNNNPVPLMDFITTLEDTLGIEAIKEMAPMAKGDVYETYANIDAAQEILGFNPTTTLNIGIPKFVDWYRNFYQ